MANKIHEAIKFYKTAAKTQAENIAAVYGTSFFFYFNNQKSFCQVLFIVKYLKENMTKLNNKLNFKMKFKVEMLQ
jgi:hypothetical protein